VLRVSGDLLEHASLIAAVDGAQRIYHVAADYRLWAPDPEEIYQSNVAGTRHLLESARRAGIERLVHTSNVATLAVPRGDELLNEGPQARLEEMIGHYKRSKYLAEQEVLSAAHDGLPGHCESDRARWSGGLEANSDRRIILDFLQGRMPAYVETGLNLVPVESVALGHLLAAEQGRSGERYILGGRNIMLKEILDALFLLPVVSAVSRGFHSKGYAWRGTGCLCNPPRRKWSWASRPGRSRTPCNARYAGTRRTTISSRAHCGVRLR
jgi:dihydroflavonol-4-reductase